MERGIGQIPTRPTPLPSLVKTQYIRIAMGWVGSGSNLGLGKPKNDPIVKIKSRARQKLNHFNLARLKLGQYFFIFLYFRQLQLLNEFGKKFNIYVPLIDKKFQNLITNLINKNKIPTTINVTKKKNEKTKTTRMHLKKKIDSGVPLWVGNGGTMQRWLAPWRN